MLIYTLSVLLHKKGSSKLHLSISIVHLLSHFLFCVLKAKNSPKYIGVFEAIHDLHARSQVSRGGHIFSEKELRITEGRKIMKIQGPGKLVNICSN